MMRKNKTKTLSTRLFPCCPLTICSRLVVHNFVPFYDTVLMGDRPEVNNLGFWKHWSRSKYRSYRLNKTIAVVFLDV